MCHYPVLKRDFTMQSSILCDDKVNPKNPKTSVSVHFLQIHLRNEPFLKSVWRTQTGSYYENTNVWVLLENE